MSRTGLNQAPGMAIPIGAAVVMGGGAEKRKAVGMSYSEYYDRVLGCWLGKSLGGCGGVAYEGLKRKMPDADFRKLFNASVPNDDFDLQIMWLQALEERGPYLTTADMACLWGEVCTYPWSEYGYFMKNHHLGIKAPYSGWFNNEFFKEAMGCPIRSEIWAVAYPGMPDMAGMKAMEDASLDHAGNSIYGEAFLARLESLLFTGEDLFTAVADSIARIDHGSKLHACLLALLNFYQTGVDFDTNLEYIYRNYSHPDFTNSIQNIAISILAVLYGERDMERTINLALSGGYDADCTCATAGAIVGIALGAQAIPQDLKDMIDDSYVSGLNIKRSDNRITTFARDSARVGVSLALHHGHIEITGLPTGFEPLCWDAPQVAVALSVHYAGLPVIGVNDACELTVTVRNHTSRSVRGRLALRGLKAGWTAAYNDRDYEVGPGEAAAVSVYVATGGLDRIDQKNLLKAAFVTEDGTEYTEMFGIAGAAPYRAYGPFFGMADWKSDESWPKCHGEADLPSILSMIHNEVFLDTEYLDEQSIMNSPETYTERLIGTVNAKEDVIPLEDYATVQGECGFIVVCDVVFPEAMQAWTIIGNNDAFKLYLNGECRLSRDEHFMWTPINNAFLGDFKKGRNRVVIKLLRRCETLKFSIGFKHYDGKHYHQTFWLDDLSYEVIG